MTKEEQDRVNQFVKNIINGPNRYAIQIPEKEDNSHTMVVTIDHIIQEMNAMVKDLERIEDEQKD